MKKTGKKRKIKEALYINSMDPKKLMNLEKGFETNQCWNEFNPHIWNIAFRKAHLKIFAFSFTVGDGCVSIESDRRNS